MEPGTDRSVRGEDGAARPGSAGPAPSGDLTAIRALLAQTPDERFLGLVRAATFFAAAERV